MLLFRQRRAVLHRSQPSPTAAAPSGSTQVGSTLLIAVPGFRYLLRRLPVSGVAVSLFAATLALCPAPAQARRSARKVAKAPDAPKPTGVWAWTSGSQTYIRARPGVQTPPIAKVARHTKLFVWGRFTEWYRVETLDHKFGWIHSDCLNSADLEKAHEMSHFAAKQASDRTENQTMYGSVEMLKKHYERYGALGARKGLEEMGVSVASKSRPAKTVAKVALKAPVVAKVQPKPEVKVAPKVAAQPAKVAPKPVAKASVIAPQKPEVAKTAPKEAVKPVAKAPVKAKAVAQLKVETPVPVLEETKAPEARPVAVSAVTPTGKLLNPSLPNPTVAAPKMPVKVVVPVAVQPKAAPKAAKAATMQRLAPAIPFVPDTPPRSIKPRTAKSKNTELPEITVEDLLRARQDHLRQKPVTNTPVPKESGNPLFVPSSYSPSTLPPNHFSPQDNSGRAHILTLDLNYARPEVPEQPRETPASPIFTSQVQPVAAAPKVAPKSAPPAAKTLSAKNPTFVKKTPVKPIMVSGPARGGSPRDFARIASVGAFGSNLANSALAYRGRPYISGASSPSRGFDCSGLVYYLLRQRGMNPPRTAAGLARYGKPVAAGQLQPGDLVLFANTYKRGVSHVGVYLGNNNFVHAATHGEGVRVDSLGGAYYCRKYYGARRVN